MQGSLIEVLQKRFIALEIYDPFGKFCCLRIRFAIIPDQLGDGFDLIRKHPLINRQAQAMFAGIELSPKLPLL